MNLDSYLDSQVTIRFVKAPDGRTDIKVDGKGLDRWELAALLLRVVHEITGVTVDPYIDAVDRTRGLGGDT